MCHSTTKRATSTLAVAIATGTAVAMGTTLAYIPSYIHTLMKFRSGVIPSLRDPHFIGYRTGLQDMAYLIGAMFWGLITTTSYLVVIIAVCFFALVWQGTQTYVLNLLAEGE